MSCAKSKLALIRIARAALFCAAVGGIADKQRRKSAIRRRTKSPGRYQGFSFRSVGIIQIGMIDLGSFDLDLLRRRLRFGFLGKDYREHAFLEGRLNLIRCHCSGHLEAALE